MKKILILFLFLMCSIQAYATNEETLILLDSSVSMLEPFGETPKYLLAINEAKKVLTNYDKTKPIGLRTIGISIENAMDFLTGDTESFCTATKLVSPIAQNNINEINKSEPGWSGGKKKREREGWSRYKLPTTRMRISL